MSQQQQGGGGGPPGGYNQGGGGSRGGYNMQQAQQQRPMGAWQPAAPTSLQVATGQSGQGGGQSQQGGGAGGGGAGGQQYGGAGAGGRGGYGHPQQAHHHQTHNPYYNPYVQAGAHTIAGAGQQHHAAGLHQQQFHHAAAAAYTQQRGGAPPGAWGNQHHTGGYQQQHHGGTGVSGGPPPHMQSGAYQVGGGRQQQGGPQQHHHHQQHRQQQQQQHHHQSSLQSAMSTSAPRKKKPLLITDKDGNVVDLTSEANKKKNSSKEGGGASSSDNNNKKTTNNNSQNDNANANGNGTEQQKSPSSLQSTMDAGAKLRQAALERIQNKDAEDAAKKKKAQEEAELKRKKEEEELAIKKAEEEKKRQQEEEKKRKEEEELAKVKAEEEQKRKEEEELAKLKQEESLRKQKEAEEEARKQKEQAILAAQQQQQQQQQQSQQSTQQPKSSLSSMLAKQQTKEGTAATSTPSTTNNATTTTSPPPPRSSGGLRPGGASGLRPGGAVRPSASSPTAAGAGGSSSSPTKSSTNGGKRHVYSKAEMLRLKSLPVCLKRPEDLPEFVISRGPSRSGGGGGGGDRGGGNDRGGDRRSQRGGDGGGGGGGGQWARGAAPPNPQRRSSSNNNMDGNSGGGDRGDHRGGGDRSGGGQWARGQAPPKPQPNQQNQQGGGGRRGNRGNNRGNQGGPPYFDGPVAPLVKSTNGWRPKKDPSALAQAEKSVKAILNKMTKEKFDRLASQMCEIPIISHDMLTMMIHNVYEKAIDEPAFGDMYGDLCIKLSQHVQGNSFVQIVPSDEEPPTEDGTTAPSSSGGQSSTYIVYRWSNDVSTSDAEIVGPFNTPEECKTAALDTGNEKLPIERKDMVLELHSLQIKNGNFIKILKKKDAEDGEENIYYTVFFPVANHKECGQQLSDIFLSERECVSDATKQNSFKRSLLNKCEDEFNKQDIYVDWKKEKKEYDETKSTLTESARSEKQEELDFRRMKIKKQMLGNIKFIGQLYKKNLLKEKIMKYCIASLLKLDTKDEKVKSPIYTDSGDIDMDEEDHEAICSMFTTIGSTIDRPPAADFMKVCFTKIKKLSTEKSLISRSRFMYKDLIELRDNNWVPRRKEEKAKTLDEIRKEVEREERLQAQQSQQNYRGGGGNRGDRNDYSGGNRGGRGGGGGDRDRDYRRSSQNYSSNSNRSRQPKQAVETDDDGFTVIGGGSSLKKSSLAQAASHQHQQSRSHQATISKSSYAALNDESSNNNKGSNNAASGSSSSGQAATLSKEQLERRIKTIRNEFMQDPKNIDELLLSIDELKNTPDYGMKFCSVNNDRIMDCKDHERKAIFSMLSILCEKNKLTSNDIKEGIKESGIIEFIDSMVYDAPKAYEYLGELLSSMIKVNAINLPWICEQCELTKLALAENPEKIIKALIKIMETNDGKDTMKRTFMDTNSIKALDKLFGGDKWKSFL